MTADVDQSAIAYNTGMSYYGDDQMFRSQICSFETMTLDPELEEVHEAWKSKNYPEIARRVQKLKGAARYFESEEAQ